jgi:hypothetical protein
VEPAAAASEEVATSVQEMCEELPDGIKEVSAVNVATGFATPRICAAPCALHQSSRARFSGSNVHICARTAHSDY